MPANIYILLSILPERICLFVLISEATTKVTLPTIWATVTCLGATTRPPSGVSIVSMTDGMEDQGGLGEVEFML